MQNLLALLVSLTLLAACNSAPESSNESVTSPKEEVIEQPGEVSQQPENIRQFVPCNSLELREDLYYHAENSTPFTGTCFEYHTEEEADSLQLDDEKGDDLVKTRCDYSAGKLEKCAPAQLYYPRKFARVTPVSKSGPNPFQLVPNPMKYLHWQTEMEPPYTLTTQSVAGTVLDQEIITPGYYNCNNCLFWDFAERPDGAYRIEISHSAGLLQAFQVRITSDTIRTE